MEKKITIEQYLEKISGFAGSKYGKMVREQFQDITGASELAMLAAPNKEELAQLKRAIAIMTTKEKDNAEKLTDEQVQKIAADANVEPALLAIFMNGYVLHCKRVS